MYTYAAYHVPSQGASWRCSINCKHTTTCAGGNPDSNTLLSEYTTVICLDDYHCLDRYGRKEKKVTALAPEAQDFELMY